jgi:YbgC/YbaW family acyl-CoA thioester hydrolase
MNRGEFRYFDRQRVRWAEVDMQKIVFNGHYLMYFDTALAGYWRAMAMPYQEAMQHLDGDLYVRKATLDYLTSAHYDDTLDVGIRCKRIGNSSVLFDAAVFRAERLLVSGELVYVFANPATQSPLPVPDQLRALLQDFEAGKPMLDVRLGTWDEIGREAQAIRTTVFVEEQQIPAEMEWDAADASCVHAVAYNRFGMALGTGRLLEHSTGVAKIGRMAVLPTMRGAAIGRALLDALVACARQRGERQVLLHAQMSAAGFYLRAHFRARGEPFDEAGIPHLEMVRDL